MWLQTARDSASTRFQRPIRASVCPSLPLPTPSWRFQEKLSPVTIAQSRWQGPCAEPTVRSPSIGGTFESANPVMAHEYARMQTDDGACHIRLVLLVEPIDERRYQEGS